MIEAIGNSYRVFAPHCALSDCGQMLTADEILQAINQRGVTRTELASVLGISQPNATRLYTPDGRTGKKRALGYEEGRMLVQKYHLEDDAADTETEAAIFNEELLVPIVQEIAAQAGAQRPETIARPLASALSRYLELIVGRPAIHANPDALEAVAQSVSPPARRSKRQA